MGFINLHSVAKYEKTRSGDPFEALKFFSKKVAQCRKKSNVGDLLGTSGFVGFLEKVKKMKGGPFGLSLPWPDLASGSQVVSGLFLKNGPISVRIVV